MSSTDKEFENLCTKLNNSGRQYDLEIIRKAYDIAHECHVGQLRKSGEEYITHPLEVAEILFELGMDTESITAAILHDVVEDTEFTSEEIELNFGATISDLVSGVTKIGSIPFSTDEEQQAENVRKMLMAMSKDIRVIVIKLADRLHNMRTLEFMTKQKQRDKAKETMEVYAPIAHRLGMRHIKEELEDLALMYLDPIAYNEIVETLDKRNLDKGDYLTQINENILARVNHISADLVMESRVKSKYGIYRKMYMHGRDFEEIYDIYAIRIIVNSVEECYTVLGIVHDMYRLIPNRFKDYISTPKKNMYQSLHTTVIGKEGVPVEVQIRTFEMHRMAEYGIAAHWKYKVGIEGKDKLDQRLTWISEIINRQNDSDDVEDLVRSIKIDLSPEDIFVLTPNSDIITLPSGATVIDFAYNIHSAVGNKMIGAKVDGRIVPLEHKLKTGQIVEIITTKSQNHGPSMDWLKLVRTSEARGKIKAWFKKEKREENVERGRADFERELRRAQIRLTDEQMIEVMEIVLRRCYCATEEDFYAAIGYRGIQLSKIIPKIKNEALKFKQDNEPDEIVATNSRPRTAKGGVIVEGLDNCLIKFAKCCSPLPGEEIVGFVTRGFGVSIHKKHCHNVTIGQNDPEQAGRWVEAYWDDGDGSGAFAATFDILAKDNIGIFASLSNQLAGSHIPILSINARKIKNGECIITLTIEITSLNHLNSVLIKLRKVEDVISIERSGN